MFYKLTVYSKNISKCKIIWKNRYIYILIELIHSEIFIYKSCFSFKYESHQMVYGLAVKQYCTYFKTSFHVVSIEEGL